MDVFHCHSNLTAVLSVYNSSIWLALAASCLCLETEFHEILNQLHVLQLQYALCTMPGVHIQCNIRLNQMSTLINWRFICIFLHQDKNSHHQHCNKVFWPGACQNLWKQNIRLAHSSPSKILNKIFYDSTKFLIPKF